MGQNKADHLLHIPSSKPGSVTFSPVFESTPELYDAYLYIPRFPYQNREFDRYSNKVGVEILSAGNIDTLSVDPNAHIFDWAPLGTFAFQSGDYIRILANDPLYPVPADAVLLVPHKN